MNATIRGIKEAITLAKKVLADYRTSYVKGQMNQSDWIRIRESFAGKINGLYQALEIAETEAIKKRDAKKAAEAAAKKQPNLADGIVALRNKRDELEKKLWDLRTEYDEGKISKYSYDSSAEFMRNTVHGITVSINLLLSL